MTEENKIVHVHTGVDRGLYRIHCKTDVEREENIPKDAFRSYSALLVRVGHELKDHNGLAKSHNFYMCHSLSELDERYALEIKEKEEEIEALRNYRDYSRGEAVEAGMPDENPAGLTCKTEYKYFHDNGVAPEDED